MLRLFFLRCVRSARSVPRACWILLLLFFQIFEVYVLWPSGAGNKAVIERAPNSDAPQVQSLQSQLPAALIEHLNRKWLSASLPDLNQCKNACQCDSDKSGGKTAVAWTVDQIQHRAGTTTIVMLQWLPDGANSAAQCVFGDRIVKGQLIDSGDFKTQKAGASSVLLALPLTLQATQISCVAPPRFHLVQPGESLYSIAQSHGLSHTMCRPPASRASLRRVQHSICIAQAAAPQPRHRERSPHRSRGRTCSHRQGLISLLICRSSSNSSPHLHFLRWRHPHRASCAPRHPPRVLESRNCVSSPVVSTPHRRRLRNPDRDIQHTRRFLLPHRLHVWRRARTCSPPSSFHIASPPP
jgi:hypothetical protein